MTGPKLSWIMRPGVLDMYLAAAERIDKEVWTTVCNPGSVAVEFCGEPNFIGIHNRLAYPVMLVHDTDLYKTEWGTVAYGRASMYNEARPYVRQTLHVMGIRVYSGYPEVFEQKIVRPGFMARYLDIGDYFKGLEEK